MTLLKNIEISSMIDRELNKIFIVDFDDSFTYNILSSLVEFDSKYEDKVAVLHFSQIENILKQLKQDERYVVILGPGPGHPSDYEIDLSHFLDKKNVLLFGICLGHQLIWNHFDISVERCSQALHGESVEFCFSDLDGVKKSVNVQRYNSLVPKLSVQQADELNKIGWALYFDGNELIYSKKDNICSMQFHPESIGTSCPQLFFRPISEFLL